MDHSHDTRISRNPALRVLWLALGLVFTGVGVLGYILPLMPGTVFLIVAAFFLARSSPRLHHWLLHNHLFGRVLRDWFAGLGLPLRTKALILSMIAVSITISSIYAASPYVRAILILVGLGVGFYIATRPTKPQN